MANRRPDHKARRRIAAATCPCPICGIAGRRVTPVTLDHHVPAQFRAAIGHDATFCLNPVCEVVYCNPAGFAVRKGQTLLPVTQKDLGDEVLVCYCFEHRRGDLRRGLQEMGNTDIPGRIKKGIADGRCDCERKNPQGACCLANVAAAVRTIKEEAKAQVEG